MRAKNEKKRLIRNLEGVLVSRTRPDSDDSDMHMTQACGWLVVCISHYLAEW